MATLEGAVVEEAVGNTDFEADVGGVVVLVGGGEADTLEDVLCIDPDVMAMTWQWWKKGTDDCY